MQPKRDISEAAQIALRALEKPANALERWEATEQLAMPMPEREACGQMNLEAQLAEDRQ